MPNAAIIIGTDNRVTDAVMEGSTLYFLQGAVGGLIQNLPFPVAGVDAWVNEEGKYDDACEPNAIATALMHQAGLLFPGDYIAGPMVLTSCNEEGDTIGLSYAQAAAIVALLGG